MTQRTIEIRKGKNGKWHNRPGQYYYVWLGGNGKVLSTSEMYSTKWNVDRAVRAEMTFWATTGASFDRINHRLRDTT